VPVVPVELVLLVVSLLDVGFVEAVVFKLPLVFSLVVLGLLVDCEVESLLEVLLDGEVLYITALELLERGEAEED
jgi:hypothetical protein